MLSPCFCKYIVLYDIFHLFLACLVYFIAKNESIFQNYGTALTKTLNDSLASKPDYSETRPVGRA